MPVIDVYNMEGKTCGTIDLNEKIFGAPVNVPVMHSVVRAYLLNQRQGTQSTLTRSEVAGGGRKPWRQKGTGRARQGSTRAPQWTKGGIALGLDNIALEEFKTKKIVAMLAALGANGKPMIVTEKPDQKVVKSAANIPGVATAPVNAMSVYDILKHDKLILTKAAVASLEEVYGE